MVRTAFYSAIGSKIKNYVPAVLDHHYKNLLLNLPVRHLISRLSLDSDQQLAAQLTRLNKMDLNNFFILGSPSTIHTVLQVIVVLFLSISHHAPTNHFTALWLRQVATRDLMMYGEKFAWFAGTKHSGAQLDHTCCKEIDVRRNS